MKQLIFCISGWGKPDFLWAPFQKRFQNEGWDVIRASYPHRGMFSIEESSIAVQKALRVLRSEYDHITLVGHSMGGLIGRHAIVSADFPLVDAYISLGTPHSGTRLAKWIPWPSSAHQMAVGSDFLLKLHSYTWPLVPALALQAQFEELVLPHSSATIPFGQNILIPHTMHASLLLSERAFWECYAWLQYEVLDEAPTYKNPGRVSVLS